MSSTKNICTNVAVYYYLHTGIMCFHEETGVKYNMVSNSVKNAPVSNSLKIPKIIHHIWIQKETEQIDIPHSFLEIVKNNIVVLENWQFIIWNNIKQEVISNVFEANANLLFKNIKELRRYNQYNNLYDKFYNENLIIFIVEITRPMILEEFGGAVVNMGYKFENSPEILHHMYDFYADRILYIITGGYVASKASHNIASLTLALIKEYIGPSDSPGLLLTSKVAVPCYTAAEYIFQGNLSLAFSIVNYTNLDKDINTVFNVLFSPYDTTKTLYAGTMVIVPRIGAILSLGGWRSQCTITTPIINFSYQEIVVNRYGEICTNSIVFELKRMNCIFEILETVDYYGSFLIGFHRKYKHSHKSFKHSSNMGPVISNVSYDSELEIGNVYIDPNPHCLLAHHLISNKYEYENLKFIVNLYLLHKRLNFIWIVNENMQIIDFSYLLYNFQYPHNVSRYHEFRPLFNRSSKILSSELLKLLILEEHGGVINEDIQNELYVSSKHLIFYKGVLVLDEFLEGLAISTKFIAVERNHKLITKALDIIKDNTSQPCCNQYNYTASLSYYLENIVDKWILGSGPLTYSYYLLSKEIDIRSELLLLDSTLLKYDTIIMVSINNGIEYKLPFNKYISKMVETGGELYNKYSELIRNDQFNEINELTNYLRIHNWTWKKSLVFTSIKEERITTEKKMQLYDNQDYSLLPDPIESLKITGLSLEDPQSSQCILNDGQLIYWGNTCLLACAMDTSYINIQLYNILNNIEYFDSQVTNIL